MRKLTMTEDEIIREVHEEAAGMGLDPLFFALNDINPDAIYEEPVKEEKKDEDDKRTILTKLPY